MGLLSQPPLEGLGLLGEDVGRDIEALKLLLHPSLLL